MTKRITLDETVVSKSYMMRNNSSIGEKALVKNPTSENKEPESQMSGEGPVVGGEGLAAVAAN
ncbi:MAG TPA: hypothetical protein VE288_02115 [Rubrobacteraceae bacterium]|nr:hypothetical protein [Rubrobacteraceae bacterium]